MATNVLNGGSFLEELNEARLVLIPKIENQQSVNQLPPIGLCNVAYMAISKAIVNMIKPVLSKLVAPIQISFVPEHQISDNIVIVQEMLHTMRHRRGKVGYMVIKMDLEKAYACIRWPLSLIHI